MLHERRGDDGRGDTVIIRGEKRQMRVDAPGDKRRQEVVVSEERRGYY